MKPTKIPAARRVMFALCLALAMPASALVFTSDTLITPTDSTYEGLDLVVSNAVLTVDGTHAFNSLRIASGATLTHTASPGGNLPITATVSDEIQVLGATNPVMLTNANIILASVLVRDTNSLITYTNDVDYLLTTVDLNLTLERTTNSSIPDGDTVLVSYNFLTTTNAGLNLTLTNNFELEAGALVDLDGRGRGGGQGPGLGGSAGSPTSGSGAGHGGFGGVSAGGGPGGAAYDSAASPASLGSGGGAGNGGSGGAGGGLLRLSSGGNCIINGLLTADGANATNSRAGGGAGGSLWITTQTFSGTGIVRARGGAGEPINGGGGGGGRIAVTFATNLFTGTVMLNGGTGWQRGGAGTFFLQTNSSPASVLVDNGGLVGAGTPLDSIAPLSGTLEIRGRAIGVAASSTQKNFGNLIVRANSMLTTTATNNATLTLFVTGNALLETGASLAMDTNGFSANTGTGSGNVSTVGSGAGHGGSGGAGVTPTAAVAGGSYYGNITGPTTVGSGGRSVGSYPGGAGGGVVRLTVIGNFQLDGKISATAGAGGGLGGGGSGGSVWLTLGTFSGNGSVFVNGGAGGPQGNGGGGGAGGRIAITFNTNLFTGKLAAFGGAGGLAGGAGTIYTKTNSANYADLRVDNNGLPGTNTTLDVALSCNLLITNTAVLRTPITSTLFFNNLDIATNSAFILNTGGTTIFVNGNLTLAAGGLLSSDGLGATGGQGTGPGQTSSGGSGGAGYGGYGGRGATAAGGNAYGLAASPGSTGSGGGGSISSGGAGGGTVIINCAGFCRVDGRISANGLNTSSNNAGGGSGGSINLNLKQFAGTGFISADGGSGHLPNGGGGGGGRIVVQWTSNTFTGTYSAKGGLGYNAGGAGTICLKYLSPIGATTTDLIIDNTGIPNSNSGTLLDLSPLSNLVIGPGSTVTSTLSSFSILGNLDLQPNATLSANATFTISSNANIAAGGWLSADGKGTSNTGFGQSGSVGSGGGGHGGYGGRGASAPGGIVYDSTSTPTQSGSVGGGSTPPYGGVGGGFLRLNVSGLLTLNGKISANGTGLTSTNAGGGSGGTVYLALNQFAGNGSIFADGGPGSSTGGGGGGGGRIAVYFSSNAFTGTLSAKGGPGYQAGGAGTTILKANTQLYPSLIVDNGGLSGTNTVLDLISLANLTVTGGAQLKASSSVQTLTLTTLTIQTNSALITYGPNSSLTLNLSGAADIAAGGSLSADGQGTLSGSGQGAGAGNGLGSGGGGHAGNGGRGANANGGNAYGSLTSPTTTGSSGGSLNSTGGNGGGFIRINAGGDSPFVLNGIISANGFNTFSNNAGGGAGGSLWLTFNQLLGAGSIIADGGNGHLPNGGGGGGGRISLSYNFISNGNTTTNGFTGTISAKGGNGFMRGGAGTIYLRTNNPATAIVLVDNGGSRGANTSVSGTSSYDLFVQGGAIATSLGTPRDLFVRSNSSVAQSGNLSITRNATFEGGGGINLDGLGTSLSGTGSTGTSPKGGAGHGGFGALNLNNFGNVYDSAPSPSQSGSQGGNGSGTTGAPYGGMGGGALQLTVGNTLLVNGEISADGLNGDVNSGGGSGGGLRLQTVTLAGSGEISAKGGNGSVPAGGGGGGRIAIYYSTNLFTGALSACGGSGGLAGGAGTIFLNDNFSGTSLLLDNCGQTGPNTPITSAGIANSITVSGGAVAEFQGAIPVFSNLVIGANSFVTGRQADPNLFLALLGELNIAPSGGISVDGKGNIRATGTGAGATLSSKGSGGGYGGAGGASASGAIGGAPYGSTTQPVDRGSGGGLGGGSVSSGSEGGGAIRIAARRINVDGLISANGKDGIQDDSGGGSGGSIWISAEALSGTGTFIAAGGNGDLYGGGGGGGGRIAIYAPTNDFAGIYSAAAGSGAFSGSTGSIYTASSLLTFEVVGQTPTGVVSNVTTQIALEFSEAIDPTSLVPGEIKIFTPTGLVPTGNLSVTLPSLTTLQINFPTLNTPGDYRLELGPSLRSAVYTAMSQVYTGSFTLTLPVISGTVTDTNNQPVAGVSVQPDYNAPASLTDANGNYSIGVPPGWSGTITPSSSSGYFAPGHRSYSGITTNLTGENFVLIPDIAPTLGSGLSGTNLFIRWSGYTNINYQLWSSTNLIDWVPVGDPIPGVTGPMELLQPTTDQAAEFLRVRASN